MLTRTYGSYSTSVAANGRINIRAWFDASAGSSGSGLNQRLFSQVGDPTQYYTGVLHGKETLTGENLWFRRMDPSFYSFIVSYSTEY
jgi:hypothetical protein